MTCRLDALVVDARDPAALAVFWAGVLGWEVAGDGAELLPTDDTGFGLRFVRSGKPKVAQNRMHPELTSASLEDQRATVERALALGGRHVDVGQRGDEGHVVLGDPEGNEFCVIEPGNRFLAGCGFLGALSCDGSQAVGRFWSEALGWPLVWDQDEETAIRSPHGGPKITWDGVPMNPEPGRNRLRFDLVATATRRRRSSGWSPSGRRGPAARAAGRAGRPGRRRVRRAHPLMATRGTVRVWHTEEGWGVIDSAETPGGCWTHFSAVLVPGFAEFAAGEDVTFTFDAADQDGYRFRTVEAWPAGRTPVRHEVSDPSPAYGSTLTLTFDAGDAEPAP